MRAVIYSRVSTRGQAEEELPMAGQEAECRAYAKDKGWEVVNVYQDAGYSGGTIDRPAFQEMYVTAKDTKPRPFDIVLTWRSNRLFRDVEARLAYSRLFKRMGIRLVSLHEPEYGESATGRLAETIFGAIDEYYRAQVSEDTLRGLKLVARRGYSTGGKPPTGYRNVRKLTGNIKPNGEPEMRTMWEPDPVLASKVRQVFEMSAAGRTNVEIVEATKVVAAKNGLTTLLRNRAYIGERIYNTTRRASLSEKKYHRLKNAPEAIIILPDSHPPIVSRELFDQVQAALDRKRPKIGQRKYSRHEYILSGLLWCKEHDCVYSGHTTGERMYYACAMRKKLGKKLSPCTWLKKDAIEKFILDNLKENIITPDIVRQGLEIIQAEESRSHREDDAEQREIEGQIAQSNLELTRYYAAIKSGVHADAMATPINELHERINRLNKRQAEIKREREKALKLPVITDTMVDNILDKVHAMLDTTDRKELKAALSHFIERIEIHGQDVTIEYSFKKPTTIKVSTDGDPGGLATVGTIFKAHLILDSLIFPRNTNL